MNMVSAQRKCTLPYVLLVMCLVLFINCGTMNKNPSVIRNKFKVNTVPINLTDYTNSSNPPKIILIWSKFDEKGFLNDEGQKPFIAHNCSVNNCLLTRDRNLQALDKFDAILFHASEHPKTPNNFDFPEQRAKSQVYVFVTQESSKKLPYRIGMNGTFNMTMTHRLDSDIVYPYFSMMRIDGGRNKIVSPAYNPSWVQPNSEFSSLWISMHGHGTKMKPVAWIRTHCNVSYQTDMYVKDMQINIPVDAYGKCARYRYPIRANFLEVLRRDYFFLLIFESATCKDFITDSILKALENDVVPILFSGANVTRFLPVGSYIDARMYSPTQLTVALKFLMQSPVEYARHFWWKNFYKVVPPRWPLCDLCLKLHDKHRKWKSYANFKNWWEGTIASPVCKVY